MPATKEKNPLERATVPDLYGAGSEPSGEPPASPPGILESVPDDIRRQLPDEVVDELLAGAKTEEEIFGPGGVFGGRVSEDVGGFLRKNMAKNTPAEFRDRRDWTAIEAWATRIADSLQDQLMAEGSR